jgi:fibronectin type 3 domain-containing protein
MLKEIKKSKREVSFAWTMSLFLIISSMLIGISFEVPTVEGGTVIMNVGNLNIGYITDYGRLIEPLSLDGGGYQTVRDGIGFSYAGLVIDQDNYNHVPGSEDIAECYEAAWPYAGAGDFATQTPISYLINDGITQKSYGSYQNTQTADPNDILVDQTAWSVLNKDWVLLQWRLTNQKVVPITGVSIGLEVPISKVGSTGGGGPGGDNGDDVDGFDVVSSIYWASDDSGTTLGFASAVPTDPITHYYAEDYEVDYSSEYINFYADEAWLYNRLTAPNATATDGINPGNITATVGWDGFDIPVGGSKTLTLVMAINDTFLNMQNAVSDAQNYYHYEATNFQITEIRDSGSASPRIEVYNNGRPPTDPTSLFSFTANVGALTGSWSQNPVPTYGYSYFTPNEIIDDEGDTITLYESGVQIDQVSFGQDGIAPDPLIGESSARWYNNSGMNYSDEWVRDSTPTWDAQNDVANITSLPQVVINRVMFNPLVDAEGYVELMYTGNSTLDISGWKIVCDDAYNIPVIPNLSQTAPFYVFTQSDMPSFFTIGGNMDAAGDNVYLYNDMGNLVDMVGWSSAHIQGRYMSRTPDGAGTHQGFNDVTSIAAGWTFDHTITAQLSEFYADPTTATIELYNPRGGDKILDSRWTIDSVESGGALAFTWSMATIPANGGHEFSTSLTAGNPGDEGDTISLYYDDGGGPVLMDIVSFGVYGVAPDPLSTESTARFWDSTAFDLNMEYTDEWTRDDIPTWGAQNNVPAINSSSFVILNEVMFNPLIVPSGKFFVVINRQPGLSLNISNYVIVSDAEYILPSFPTTPGGFDGILYPPDDALGRINKVLISFADGTPASDAFFNSLNDVSLEGDNVYFYDPSGSLLDMVGWNTQHTQGMSVRRVPNGNGTHQGYDDISSEAAGWVYDSPLEVQITEISDDSGVFLGSIEVYNPDYPLIDFNTGGYTFESTLVSPLTGTWTIPTADKGQYALFNLTAAGLDFESDMIYIYQNGYLIEIIGYGNYGTVPDPLADESVQRYFNGDKYTDYWGRNWTTGPNFGIQNDIPAPNLTSTIKLNEVMFYPMVSSDGFIEIMQNGSQAINITGFKIVCDRVYEIPNAIIDGNKSFFYLFEFMYTQFFSDMQSTGDNVYLYDANGAFLDMVGWNSQHTQGKALARVPNGNGTRDGYDDVSSYTAGWRFDRAPSVNLIKIENQGNDESIKWGNFGEYIIFNLTISNFQAVTDTIDILNSTEEGWLVEIFDENQTVKISQLILGADGIVNITVNVTLPGSIPFAVMDNVTITIQSTSSLMITDQIVLTPRILAFIHPEKTVSPSTIYVSGSGHDEVATITLNLTGMGSQIILNQPQDIIFCVDTSGSMEPSTIDRLKEGFTNYVDNMNLPDQGAVVPFGGTAFLMNALTQDYLQLKNDVSSIPGPGGGTMMVAALQTAITELDARGVPGHYKTVILTSDGSPTDGTPDDVRNLAGVAASKGIRIYTMGFEPQIGFPPPNLQLLKDVANITGGEYYYSPSAAEIGEIYGNISGYLVDIAGRDTNIFDSDPMVRDVLPPWIDYVPGSHSIPPDTLYKNASGYTIMEWNISSIGIGETWSVSFNITSMVSGFVEANNLSASRIMYVDIWDTTIEKLFPLTMLDVLFDLSAPWAPINLIATAGSGYINLTWDAPLSDGNDPITNYRIYKGTTSGGEAFYMEIGNVTTFNDTAVIPGVTYYYMVSAVNGIGEGPLSNEANAMPYSVPSEPVNLGAAAGDGYVNLSWNVPISNGGTPITGYYIYRNGTVGIYAFVPAGQLWFNDTSVINGLTYTYNVSAVNMVGEGPNATISAMPFSPVLPSVCENLQAVSGNGYINLTWDPPISSGSSSIINYRIYKGTSSGSETFYIEIGNVTTFNDTSVTPGIEYFYKVSAVNIVGEGPLSNEASATPPTVPFAPLNLVASEGIGYIELYWDEPTSDGGSPITNYRIYRGTSSGSETFYIMIGNLTFYNDTSVTFGITYYYRVSAVNIVGEGPFSNEAFATPPAVPTQPLNLLTVAGNGYIDLSWDAPLSDGGSSIINYKIYKGTSPGSETFYIMIGNLTTFNDTSVTPGISYYYKVSAVNSFGEGPLSIEAFATPPNVPFAPLNLNAVSGIGYIDLDWDEPISDGGSPIINYKIFRGTSSGSEIFYIMIGNITTYNDTSVTPGTTYYYRVKAVNIVGDSPFSNEAYATPPTVPSIPLSLTAFEGDSYVYLEWEEPASDGGLPVSEYRIYRMDLPGIYSTVTASQLWYNDTNVINGITYTYNVSAVNELGEGPNATVIATPISPPIIPSPPMSPMASPGDGEINVSWQPPSDGSEPAITGYNIYRDGSSEIYDTVSSDQLWYIDTEVTPGTVYLYKITAITVDGEGAQSEDTNIKAGTVPSSPTNVAASSGDSYAYLTWDVPASDGGYSIINYSIYKGTVSGEEVFLTLIGDESSFNDTDVINDETYFYKIIAINTIGESAPSDSTDANPHTVNQPPKVSITSPLSLTTIKGKFEILGTASDPDGTIQRVEIKIDDGNWIRVEGTSSWNYEWDTNSVPDGLHTIVARSFDGQDYSPEINTTILVDNPITEDQPTEGLWAWILLLIIVIVIVVLFLIWFFMKKKPQDMPDGDIYAIIKQKFEEGAISEETFEDFKKRYNNK